MTLPSYAPPTLRQHNAFAAAFEAVAISTDLPPQRLRERIILALANTFGSNMESRAHKTAKRCLGRVDVSWQGYWQDSIACP